MSDENVPADEHPDIESLSFEQAQAELEQIVERLEDQHTGLEQALALWERGEALHAWCQRKLDYAAERIERLQVTQEEAAAATAEPDPFVGEQGGAAEQARPENGSAPAVKRDRQAAESERPPSGATPQSMF